MKHKNPKKDKYRDIRPLNESEIQLAMNYLSEPFTFRYFFLKRIFKKIFGEEYKDFLQEVKLAKTHDDIDKIVHSGIEKIITDSSFNIEGTNNLNPEKNYIYLSNHRLIIKDPFYLNHALIRSGMPTAMIGIGDNLTSISAIEYAVKAYRCFLVKRGKDVTKSDIKNQFNFLYDALNQGNSLWLAQRKGRAKDGNDFTDPSVLKMLYAPFKMHGMSLTSFLTENPIVPVSISYEHDPCIINKAQSLYNDKHNNGHKKSKWEDIKTMLHELYNSNHGVNIHFGDPIVEATDVASLKKRIDDAIQGNYHIWPMNQDCYEYQQAKQSSVSIPLLSAVLNSVPNHLRANVIQIYANPVRNRIMTQKEEYDMIKK